MKLKNNILSSYLEEEAYLSKETKRQIKNKKIRKIRKYQ